MISQKVKIDGVFWTKFEHFLNKTPNKKASPTTARQACHTTEKYSLLFSFCARPIFSSFNEKSIFLRCSAFQVFRVKTLTETPVGIEGMKVDRKLFEKTREELQNDPEVKSAVENEQWDKAAQIMRDKYEDKPQLFLNLEKSARAKILIAVFLGANFWNGLSA